VRKESVEPGSFWLGRRPPLGSPAPLAGRHETDVAVVGAGIAGACVALGLARAGRRVTLLDAAVPGRGATGRNAGFLLAEGAEGTAEVSRALGRATAAALRETGLRTRAEVAALAAKADVGWRAKGSIRLAGDEAEADDLAETARLVGKPLETMGRDALPAAYRGRGFHAALVDPLDGEVDPLALLSAVLAAARATGRLSEGYGDPVTAVEDGPPAVVRTARAEVRAERAVVTTNAWANELIPGPPAVRPVRAQMLAARVSPLPAWDRPAYANRGADYWRLVGDVAILGGKRLVGGDTEETDDARPAAPVQPALEALLARLVRPARAEVTTRWAGTMGFTPDGVPFAGRAPGRSRTWLLAGCNGHGMGWGAGLAAALVDAMEGRGSLAPCFDPARRAGAGAGTA
jgi:glycine/D-amino acid oxidase-like deaminating enzyme